MWNYFNLHSNIKIYLLQILNKGNFLSNWISSGYVNEAGYPVGPDGSYNSGYDFCELNSHYYQKNILRKDRAIIKIFCCRGDYKLPAAKLEALYPNGLRVSIPGNCIYKFS